MKCTRRFLWWNRHCWHFQDDAKEAFTFTHNGFKRTRIYTGVCCLCRYKRDFTEDEVELSPGY